MCTVAVVAVVRCTASDDGIGVGGAAALATHLERNNTLTELVLSGKFALPSLLDWTTAVVCLRSAISTRVTRLM